MPSTPDAAGVPEAFAAALAGQYEIEREIGRGGMGIVYLARDLRLDRPVAIKTLPPHLANDPVVRERFLREARTAARLSHQNIVPIHRADELGGFVFFVMGYVDGESLAQRVHDRGALDPREVLRDLRDVADALAYAHEHGVVHRDVKAENILIDRATGRAMVTDFGIARLAEAAPLTATGQVLGTVYYLSPEQVSGEVVDRRSDIYSLGVVGFLALSARFPFDAPLASAVLIAHVTKPPPSLRTLAPRTPPALADIVDRCLAKDPAARFDSCALVVEALNAAQSDVERDARATESASAAQLVSDEEAQAIWRRAADLQAMTGVTPRPPVHVEARDAAKDAALTSGFQVGDVRDAAREAGIPTRYVEQAMMERGLVASTAVAAVVERSAKRNPFLGAPTRLEFEVVVDGEMSPDDYDLMVDVIRRETGEAGSLGSVGRSFSWQTNDRRKNIQVSVFPRGGKTTIRVSENLRAVAGGLFGGIVGGYGGGTGGVWVGIGAHYHNPLFGVGLWIANLGIVAYGGARTAFVTTSRRHAKTLRALTDALAEQARESIAARRGKVRAPETLRLT